MGGRGVIRRHEDRAQHQASGHYLEKRPSSPAEGQGQHRHRGDVDDGDAPGDDPLPNQQRPAQQKGEGRGLPDAPLDRKSVV